MDMTSMTRTLASPRAIKNKTVLPQSVVREQWISKEIVGKQCHDGNWREHRKAKAMSWPKSFISSVITSGITSQTDCHEITREVIPEDADSAAPDRKQLSQAKQLLPSHSLSRQLGVCEEIPVVTESSATSRWNKSNETPLASKINYKQRSTDEELSVQSSSREGSSTGKNVASRRAKGGLRDLIRLHEQEIARASGPPKVCAKKPKHEDVRPSSTLFDLEDFHSQPLHNSKLSDFDQRKDPFIEKQQGRNIAESSFIDADRNQSLAERGKLQHQQSQFAEKSTSTDFADLLSPTILELELKKQVDEKDVLISLMSEEKENLLSKLEEQKKVANAYQKLEDRYRRRVYELEKLLLSCRCNAFEPKSPPEQERPKHFLNGELDRQTSASQLEIQQPSKVDSIINELETWLIDQKTRQAVNVNNFDVQDLMASESSLSSLSDFRLNSFPLEFIDQVDGTSV